jgi:hypothetical protein
MIPKIIVIEQFYDNPDDVRKYVLNNLEYTTHIYHPGIRSNHIEMENVKDKIESYLKPFFGKIDELLMSFQVNTCFEKSWIHKDDYSNLAGIIYLTPDAPVESGTDIYLSTETNTDDKEFFRWKKQNHIGNIYNRLVLFRSDEFHMSSKYFGNNIENGRLIQLLFIKTEL